MRSSHLLCIASGAVGTMALHGWTEHGERCGAVVAGALALVLAVASALSMVLERQNRVPHAG